MVDHLADTPEDRTELAIGGAVAALGVLAALVGGYYDPLVLLFDVAVALVMGAAVAAYRRAPGVALALVWLSAGLQLVGGLGFSFVQAAVLVVAFGTARYGSSAVVWASGLSIPLGVLVELGLRTGLPFFGASAGIIGPRQAFFLVTAALLSVALAVPWAVGLLLRSQGTARVSQQREQIARTEQAAADRAREQAQEIADLRERQNQLARDVHDVVGHSLTVILAQAEAAKLLPRDDPERVGQTLDTIATAARTSLHDVREVLATSDDTTQPSATSSCDTLDSLVDGVRRSGSDVRSRVVGVPRPLPPELDAVAYRTLQEMLTNALKHGDRSRPVDVEQHWDGELRLEVVNTAAAGADETRPLARPGETDGTTGGRGLDGMRLRLESVGGRLDVRRRDETFTATAWLPVRA